MCCCNSKKREKSESGPSGSKPPNCVDEKCEPTCKLVSITVIRNATHADVTGAKNWACVKKATDDVIVEATTTPNTEACWKQIKWSDAGEEVPGHANQRKLSRAASKTYNVQAELGGVKDDLKVWVLWATVNNLTTGTTPADAVQFGARYDGTENLGARSFNGGNSGVGKVVPVATITPVGMHDVVKAGWTFKRERMTHDWNDGIKDKPGNSASDYWNTAWVDDTSSASFQKLVPFNDDKIYDRDAPNIAAFGTNDAETYNNFREWIEWHGEMCSDKAGWYFQARWQKSATPQVTLNDVGAGSIVLPNDSHFHP